MASFLLGILTGILIEEVCRYGSKKMDELRGRIDDLPDIVPADGIKDETKDLKEK